MPTIPPPPPPPLAVNPAMKPTQVRPVVPPAPPLSAVKDLPMVPPEAHNKEATAMPESHPIVKAAPASTIEKLADVLGFEGLNFNAFGVRPTISLNQGFFCTNNNIRLGEEFVGYLLGSRSKYVYKPKISDDHPDSKVVYSYDDVNSVSGDPLQVYIEEWASKGYAYERKVYIDVTTQIVSSPSHALEGETILLSVPPTSIISVTKIFAGVVAGATSKEDAEYAIANTLIRVFKGPLVTKAVKPFTPIFMEILAGNTLVYP